ncbi:MAG: TRAP transporter small permease [Proteobacteria bacterium]|nr:TRAP transporter small permease [Pseudomonadota bacterium]
MILEMLDRGSARAAATLYAVGVRAALPALLAFVTLEVVLRYGFNSPLQWSRDVNGLLLLVTLFSTLPHAWDRGFHIRMEIVHRRLRGRWRSLADALSALAGLVFFGLMSIQAVSFAQYMFVTGETGEDLSVALWPFMVYVAVCGLVLCARLVANPEAAHEAGEADGESDQWI